MPCSLGGDFFLYVIYYIKHAKLLKIAKINKFFLNNCTKTAAKVTKCHVRLAILQKTLSFSLHRTISVQSYKKFSIYAIRARKNLRRMTKIMKKFTQNDITHLFAAQKYIQFVCVLFALLLSKMCVPCSFSFIVLYGFYRSYGFYGYFYPSASVCFRVFRGVFCSVRILRILRIFLPICLRVIRGSFCSVRI